MREAWILLLFGLHNTFEFGVRKTSEEKKMCDKIVVLLKIVCATVQVLEEYVMIGKFLTVSVKAAFLVYHYPHLITWGIWWFLFSVGGDKLFGE